MLKFRRFLIVFLSISLIVLVLGVVFRNQNEIAELEAKHAKLLETLNAIELDIKEKQAEVDAKKQTSIKKATGLDPEMVSTDTSLAKDYFAPAFSWRNYAEYEKARQDYITKLGEKNSFTKVYLPPDIKIETDEGDLSYIDHKKLRATLDDLYIIPLTTEGKEVRYVGFVRYFMHKEAKDLVNKNALNASQAIIEFTVKEEAENRTVTDVTAHAGFSSVEDRSN